MRLRWSLILPGLVLLMAACAGPAAEPQPTVAPQPTAVVVETTAAPEPTGAPAATAAAPEPTAVAVNPTAIAELTAVAQESAPPDPGYARTEDGYYVRGRADAPVVIDDYSDFL